jgi:protein TonB
VKRTSKPKTVSRPGKRIPKPKAVRKSQDPEKAAKAPAPQLQSAMEPEGTVPAASPHADASTVSAAPPFEAATSGGYELSDAGPGGGGDGGQGLGFGAGGGGGDRGQGSGSGAGEGAGSKDGFLNKYLMEHFAYIRGIIQKKIIYPKMARRMGWEGKVIISFVILENGCATSIRIKESSGHSLLDDNVIKTVKAISPFPRPPVKSELLVPIVYRLEGT